jgi:hypothetical protein
MSLLSSTLVSIRDFMIRATQTKWINRFMAKTSIQSAVLEYDQQLRDAAMSFQVRCQLAYPISWTVGINLSVCKIRFRH